MMAGTAVMVNRGTGRMNVGQIRRNDGAPNASQFGLTGAALPQGVYLLKPSSMTDGRGGIGHNCKLGVVFILKLVLRQASQGCELEFRPNSCRHCGHKNRFGVEHCSVCGVKTRWWNRPIF
jgi:hypothetical protein